MLQHTWQVNILVASKFPGQLKLFIQNLLAPDVAKHRLVYNWSQRTVGEQVSPLAYNLLSTFAKYITVFTLELTEKPKPSAFHGTRFQVTNYHQKTCCLLKLLSIARANIKNHTHFENTLAWLPIHQSYNSHVLYKLGTHVLLSLYHVLKR